MHREGIAKAMLKMCESRKARLEMGEIGRRRVEKFFKHPQMMERYAKLYEGAYGM